LESIFSSRRSEQAKVAHRDIPKTISRRAGGRPFALSLIAKSAPILNCADNCSQDRTPCAASDDLSGYSANTEIAGLSCSNNARKHCSDNLTKNAAADRPGNKISDRAQIKSWGCLPGTRTAKRTSHKID
jgi:hypothetical protein